MPADKGVACVFRESDRVGQTRCCCCCCCYGPFIRILNISRDSPGCGQDCKTRSSLGVSQRSSQWLDDFFQFGFFSCRGSEEARDGAVSQAHGSTLRGKCAISLQKRPHLAGARRKSEREVYGSVPPPRSNTTSSVVDSITLEVRDSDPPPITGANIWVRFQELLPLQNRDINFILTD